MSSVGVAQASPKVDKEEEEQLEKLHPQHGAFVRTLRDALEAQPLRTQHEKALPGTKNTYRALRLAERWLEEDGFEIRPELLAQFTLAAAPVKPPRHLIEGLCRQLGYTQS